MPELLEPTHVARPKPSATWQIKAADDPRGWTEGFEVSRYVDANKGETVAIRTSRNTMWAPPAVALQLGAAITAAADWTDTDVVDATIVDDWPRIECQVLIDALVHVRPSWLESNAARKLAIDLVTHLNRFCPVVITRDGEEWKP